LSVGGFDQTATFGGIIRDSDTGASVNLPDPNNPTATISVSAPWANTGNAATNAKVAITKIGSGIQTLSGANTYTGPTIINGGTLNITGSLAAASPVNINSGGGLSGTGTVGSVSLGSGGAVSPGDKGEGQQGTLNLGTLQTSGGGKIAVDLGSGTNDV